MLIVLDTNVLVSGLLNRHGFPGQVVDMILAGELRLAIDKRILDEYQQVVFRSYLKIDPSLRQDVMHAINAASARIHPHHLDIPPEKIPDPTDLPFAEVAVAAGVDALVTGNVRHFTFLAEYKVKVLTPAQFTANFR